MEKLTIMADVRAFTSGLLEIADAPLETLKRISGFLQGADELARPEVDTITTGRAGEVTVVFKPSNRLMEAVAALRAAKANTLIGE